MAETPNAIDAAPTKEQTDEMTMEDVVSQLMVDNMALKSLLVQKGVFKQEDFDATVAAISDEILKDKSPDASATT